MMDAATGEVRLDGGETLGPSLTRSGFLTTALAQGAIPLTPSSLSIGRRAIGGQTFVPSLWFDGNALKKVELSMVQATESSSWDDYSEDRELARKAKHDTWVTDNLGRPPWRFLWGDVQSEFDPRGGSSTIFITYQQRDAVPVFDVRTIALQTATGDVVLDTGERFGPKTSLTQFLSSRLAGGASRPPAPANPRQSFPADFRLSDGRVFSSRLMFDGEALRLLGLAILEDEPPVHDYRQHWNDDAALARLVRDNELSRKARHDKWLESQLGPPPWAFPWGKIGSAYDANFCKSDILVEYR